MYDCLSPSAVSFVYSASKDFGVLLRRYDWNIECFCNTRHVTARLNQALTLVDQRAKALLHVTQQHDGCFRLELANDAFRGHCEGSSEGKREDNSLNGPGTAPWHDGGPSPSRSRCRKDPTRMIWKS